MKKLCTRTDDAHIMLLILERWMDRLLKCYSTAFAKPKIILPHFDEKEFINLYRNDFLQYNKKHVRLFISKIKNIINDFIKPRARQFQVQRYNF